MNCIIIEDQPPAQRILRKYISDYGSLELLATFTDAVQSIDFLSKHKVDLIFLDIHLPKLSGVDFLKSLSNPPSIIFTTAFSEFALEGYDLNIVDYLLKPFSFTRFLQAVSKVPTPNDNIVASDNQEGEHIFIKSGFEFHRVDINDITYISSDHDYTEIHTTQKKYLSSETLKHWETLLESKNFIRTNKSYIINSRYVTSLSSSQIVLNDDTNIPIGRAYKKNVADHMNLKKS